MRITATIISLGAIALARIASAQVVTFSSFVQPGDIYDTVAQGCTVVGSSNPNPITIAYRFTANVSGILHSIRLPNRTNSGNPGIAWTLWTDSGNTLGSNMTTWSYSTASPSYHIDTLLNPFPSNVITAGSNYWIQFSTFGDGVHMWGKSSIGGLMYSGFMANNDGVWHYGNADVFPAYEVNVVVPEPATIATLALGSMALARIRRIRSRKLLG